MSKNYIIYLESSILTLLLALCILLWSGCEPGGQVALENTLYGKIDHVVTCKRGVVAVDGKHCVNATSCENDDSLCKEGFLCINKTCKPQVPCSKNDDCGAGTCDLDGGACVNPTKCIFQKESCVPGFYCREVDLKCEWVGHGCEDGCQRGYCTSEGKCVGSSRCTIETEAVDCLRGEVCTIAGKCVNSEFYCGKNPCERGICDARQQKCVSKLSCNSINDCVEGEFCKNQSCIQSECTTTDDCKAKRGGICDTKKEVCVEPDTCTNSDQCFSGGRICVQPKEGKTTCQRREELRCNPECFGGVSCVSLGENDSIQKVECVEKNECSNTGDCIEGRICNGSRCVEDVEISCSGDKFDMGSSDTIVVLDSGYLNSLKLCPRDVDRYEVPSRYFEVDKKVLITIQLTNRLQLGSGIVTVEFLEKNNIDENNPNSITIKENYDIENRTFTDRIQFVWSAGSPRPNYVKVTSKDNPKMRLSGVDYEITVQQLGDEVFEQCQNAPSISIPGETRSSFSRGANFNLGTCGTLDANVKEFRLSKESFVTIRLNSVEKDKEFGFLLAKKCSVDGQDIVEEACNMMIPARAEASIERIMSEGDYYIYVFPVRTLSASATDIGSYTITTTSEPLTCSDATHRRCDGDQLIVCNDSRTDTRTINCNLGCDRELNKCIEDVGFKCSEPRKVDNANHVREKLDLNVPSTLSDSEKQNIDSLSDHSCNSIMTSKLAGPNFYYKVVLEAGEAVYAKVSPTTKTPSTDVSLYMIESHDGTCPSTSICVASSTKGIKEVESLFYKNEESSEKVVYVVIDSETAPAATSYPIVDVDIRVYQPRCIPNSKTCIANRESVVCAEDGISFTEIHYCAEKVGCNDATGECWPAPGDQCSNAINITASKSAPGTLNGQEFKYYTNSFSSVDTTSCPLAHGVPGSNRNVIYKVSPQDVDLKRKYRFTVTSRNSQFDPMLWVVKGEMNCPGSCFKAVNDQVANNNPESLIVDITDKEPLFFIVEEAATSVGKDYQFDVKLEVID